MRLRNLQHFIILLFVIIVPQNSFSQSNQTNTLQEVKKICADKNYAQADKMIAEYYKNHASDLETIWLYAQVSHWNKKNETSRTLFEKATAIDPNNANLQLDYARMLYESGSICASQKIINHILENDKENPEALLMDGYINFWNGKISAAKKDVATINKIAPQSSITHELSQSIDETTKSYLSINGFYQKDDQPLQSFGENIGYGVYKSWLFHPKVEISNQNFDSQKKVASALFSNEFLFGKTGTKVEIAVGVFKNFYASNEFIGGLSVNQKIDKRNNFNIGFNRNAYLGTTSSTYLSLMQNKLSASFDHTNSWFSFHFGSNYQFYNDQNNIKNGNFWIVSKTFKWQSLKSSIGYGYSYSDAKNNLYEPTSLYNGQIATGIYNPYFTPKNQRIHNLILNENYSFSKLLAVTAKASIGLYATADNPYIIWDTISTYEKDFAGVNFHPLEINTNLKYVLTSKIELNLHYNYLKTYFYTSQNAGFGILAKL